jgi:two-component system sensor histidine kinase KdpD
MQVHDLRRALTRSVPGLAVGIAGTSGTTCMIALLNHAVSIPNVSLLYLPSILATAIYFGTWPSLFAAALAAVEYDFFFLQPAFTFTIAQAQDVLAFAVFVLVAGLSGQLAARARAREEAAHREAAESTALYELGQALVSGYDLNHVLDAVTRRIVDVFNVNLCAIHVPTADGQLALVAETVRGLGRRDRASVAAATWSFKQGTQIGVPAHEEHASGRHRMFIPLRTTDQVVGVMEIGPRRSGESLDESDHRLVTNFAAQAALVILRAQAEEERQRLSILEDSDRLKSALLNAVSHDLRTPLASIKASATSLLLTDASWTMDEGKQFLQAIDSEADRLNRLVGNLLDLSRIEAGALRPVLDWFELQEVVDRVEPHLRSLATDRSLTLDVCDGSVPVQIDLLRIEELLMNLVENAVRYTPTDAPIEMLVSSETADLTIAVIDHGPGIPARQRQRVFDNFFRLRDHDDRGRGTGLGLAICRGVAEAHGGHIRVEETPGGGATFIVNLPVATAARNVGA